MREPAARPTPGPYRFGEPPPGEGTRDIVIGAPNGAQIAAVRQLSGMTYGEKLANARLLAAAFELGVAASALLDALRPTLKAGLLEGPVVAAYRALEAAAVKSGHPARTEA